MPIFSWNACVSCTNSLYAQNPNIYITSDLDHMQKHDALRRFSLQDRAIVWVMTTLWQCAHSIVV